MALVMNPPTVTRKVAGSVLYISGVKVPKCMSLPKARPTLKHPLMKPASSAIVKPLGKLKSLTAAFFSSSESDEAFMLPATPMMAIPISVTTTPRITLKVSEDKASISGKKMLSNTGPMMVPKPAHVPKAMLCPSATPK